MNVVAVRNPDYLRRCKVYSWDLVTRYTPRGIQPTDIEAAIEISGKFLYFEFKTSGATMPRGQWLFYERLLRTHFANAALFVCEHEPLDIVQPLHDGVILRIQISMWDQAKRGIATTPWMDVRNGEHFGQFVKSWCDHANGTPNEFITGFRKKCGIY